MEKGKAIGLWDMMDMAMAESLGVDVQTYINIIDSKCTEEEANFIIMTFLAENEDDYEKAKETFNKYV